MGPVGLGHGQRLWHAGGYGEGGPVWLDGELDDPGGSGGPWPVVGVGGVARGGLSRRPGAQPTGTAAPPALDHVGERGGVLGDGVGLGRGGAGGGGGRPAHRRGQHLVSAHFAGGLGRVRPVPLAVAG